MFLVHATIHFRKPKIHLQLLISPESNVPFLHLNRFLIMQEFDSPTSAVYSHQLFGTLHSYVIMKSYFDKTPKLQIQYFVFNQQNTFKLQS